MKYAQYQRLVNSRRVDGVIVCGIRVRDVSLMALSGSPAPQAMIAVIAGPSDDP